MKATLGQILGKAHRLCEWLQGEATTLKTTAGAVPMAWVVAEAPKWHVGQTSELPSGLDREVIDSFPLRLPTKCMVIEYETTTTMADGRTEPITGFALCFDWGNSRVDAFFFALCIGRFSSHGGGTLSTNQEGKREFRPYEGSTATDRQAVAGIKVVERTLVALSCTNVRSVDNTPPTALNKKRQKAGKPPLFTYKTLHILSGERGASHDQRADDTEAKRSPRLHFRRGHVRRIGDGRITWVQQCMVGNRRRGVVEKAYALEAR